MKTSNIITGNNYVDHRGVIHFINDFDMQDIRRFYTITHRDSTVVRAWQGHQYENKWFHCLEGRFLVRLIKVDNWKNPSKDLSIEEYYLSADPTQVLHIPEGYVNGFQALESNSRLMIFSSMTLEESQKDDNRFDKDYWFKW